MPAVSRFVEFDADAATSYSIDSSGDDGTGKPGYVISDASLTNDTVTITQGVNDQLRLAIDGGSAAQMTLPSGTNMDARMIAQEITFKAKQQVGSEFDHILCEFVNGVFKVFSSSLGTGSTAEVSHGDNSALPALGMAATQSGAVTTTEVGGSATANSYTGTFAVSGTYRGQLDDIYTVIVGTEHPVSGVVISGTYAGTATIGGDWNVKYVGPTPQDEDYTITVDTTNGNVMNAGQGNVPTITWTSTKGDNNATPVELLYSDYWYNVGSKGLRVKFSDAPFADSDEITVSCKTVRYAAGTSDTAAVGVAKYHWSSLREGKSTSALTTSTGPGTALGTKGLNVRWSSGSNLARGDEFRVICSGPQPTGLGVTTLNFGNVTVSTYSPTRVVWFQLVSGAVILDNCRFGLQSHGSAQHHEAGNSDTKFAFGHSGEGSPGSDGTEWRTGVDGPTDLASDVPPSYLYATEDNLSVVSTAAASEPLGNIPGNMISDFIYLAIKLGAAETGANSTIIYRQYFDFS